jgi:Protein of unknown function (DUF559)
LQVGPTRKVGRSPALEAALAACDWAVGRVWNQTFQPHILANLIRVDLLWADERCVVEVDGPDHCGILKFEADRRRDVHLQLEGFAVLRFTNDQILGDVPPFVPKSSDSSSLAGRQNTMENGVQDRLGIKERAALLALMAEAKVVSIQT